MFGRRHERRWGERAGSVPAVIEAVIFDYGGVFSSPLFRGIGKFEADMGYPPGAVLELLFGDKGYIGVEGWGHAKDAKDAEAAATAGSESVTHDWHRMEIGEMTLDEWFAGISARAPEVLGQPINMDAYLTFMAEMPVGVHWPVVHKARDLIAAGVPIALLTNNVKEWGDHWRATFPVDELFEIVVDSCEVGMRKPDSRIYTLTCERVGVAPEASVFIDDNAQNIAAARALGMETVHFGEDPFVAVAELDAILERRGVKTRP
jgi:putative hydrolase of the HAD superfamily